MYQPFTKKRGLFEGSRKLLIRLKDFLGHDDCLGHDYHGHAYEAKGVREVQRQLRSISAPSLSKNYDCPLVMDMA